VTDIVYRPIGVIRSPFDSSKTAPHQPTAARGIKGRVELLPEYQEGLRDLSRFSHIYLIYHLHQVRGYSMTVVPHLHQEARGVFATRSPHRPNPIGVSLVRLGRVHDTTLEIFDLDMIDCTPLLDIKPFVPRLARRHGVRIGWLKSLFGTE